MSPVRLQSHDLVLPLQKSFERLREYILKMYALLMMKIYADEILSGRTTFDARRLPTEKRGRIAIADSSTFRVYGTAVLKDVREITYGEFVRWHQIGPFRDTPIAPFWEGRTCYAYDLEDVRILPVPVQLPKKDDKSMWVEVPDRIERNLFSQTTLI